MKYPSSKYPKGDRWHNIHRYPSKCNKCGKTGEKSDFYPLFVSMTQYDSKRILSRLCRECLSELATDLQVELPK